MLNSDKVSSRFYFLFKIGSWLQIVLLAIHLRYSLAPQWRWLFDQNSGPAFSLPGFAVFGHAEIQILLAVFTLIATLWSFRDRTGLALFFSGLLGLSSMLGASQHHYAFTFFASYFVVALGACRLARSEVPAVVALTSVYLAAGLHKLANFQQMSLSLPQYFRSFLSLDISNPDLILNLMVWTVVPVELAIGVLFFFRTTRGWGFFLAAVFHIAIQLATGGHEYFIPVGFCLLLAHALTADFQHPLKWPKKRILLTFLAAAVASPFLREGSFVHGIVQAFGLLAPLIMMAYQSYWHDPEVPDFSRKTYRPILAWCLSSIFVIWAIFPMMLGYTNEQIGWAMFSGASREKPDHWLKLRKGDCLDIFDGNVYIYTKETEIADEILYGSKQEGILDNLTRFVKERCPQNQITEQ